MYEIYNQTRCTGDSCCAIWRHGIHRSADIDTCVTLPWVVEFSEYFIRENETGSILPQDKILTRGNKMTSGVIRIHVTDVAVQDCLWSKSCQRFYYKHWCTRLYWRCDNYPVCRFRQGIDITTRRIKFLSADSGSHRSPRKMKRSSWEIVLANVSMIDPNCFSDWNGCLASILVLPDLVRITSMHMAPSGSIMAHIWFYWKTWSVLLRCRGTTYLLMSCPHWRLNMNPPRTGRYISHCTFGMNIRTDNVHHSFRKWV